MASTSRNEEQGSSSSAGSSPVEAVKTVTWGTNLKEDVFARWGQGKLTMYMLHNHGCNFVRSQKMSDFLEL